MDNKCNHVTVHYRQIRRDMIETYKIVSGKYDKDITPSLIVSDTRITRGNERFMTLKVTL